MPEPGNTPDISIVMPVFNAGTVLREAVDSIVSQDCPAAFEIVIVDDRSNDAETRAILDEVARTVPTARVVANDGPQGPAGARNRGVRVARASYLGFLDADDVLEEGALAALWQVVRDRPEVVWVGGEMVTWLAGEGRITPRPNPVCKVLEADLAASDVAELKDPLTAFAGPPFVALGTMLIRKEAFEAAGGLDESLLCGEDWDLFLKLALHHSFHFVPRVIYKARRDHMSLTTSGVTKDRKSYLATQRAYADPAFRRVRKPLRWTLISQLKNLAVWHADRSNFLTAAKYAFLAWRWGPDEPRQLAKALYWLGRGLAGGNKAV